MADKSQMQSDGGQYAVAVAAGTLAETVAYTGAGRLCRVTCLTAGTASLAIYDSNTTTGATSAVLLCVTTAALNPGDQISPQLVFQYGLLPKQVTNTPGVALNYTKDTAYGR